MFLQSPSTLLLLNLIYGAKAEHHGGTRGGSFPSKNRKLVPLVYDDPPDWTRPCGPDMNDSCRDYCRDNSLKPSNPGDTICDALPSEVVDVAIIGSGMAGLGAAREFAKYQIANPSDDFSFVVLEADNKMCGRSIAANWISGGGGNPIEDILWKNFGNAFLHHYQQWDDIKFVTDLAQNKQNRVAREFGSAYECVSTESQPSDWCPASNSPADSGLLEQFESCGWEASDEVTKTDEAGFRFLQEWYTFPYEYLYGNYRHSDNHDISLWNLPDDAYTDYQDYKDLFMAESGRAAEVCASEYIRYGLCDNVALNARVEAVNLASSPIRLEFYDGEKRCDVLANQVISTLGVGALDKQRDLSFPAKINAMNSVYKVGNYYQFSFYFDTDNFWDEFQQARLDRTQFIAVAPINFEDEYEFLCNWMQVMDTAWDGEFFPGSQSLRCVVTTTDLQSFTDPDTDTAYDDDTWLRNGDGEITDLFNEAVLPKLQRAGLDISEDHTVRRCRPYPSDLPICPTSDSPHNVRGTVYYEVFDQEDDDLKGGSYASWKRMEHVDQSFQDFKTYTEPVQVGGTDSNSYVFMSGTATCPRHYEFVQGGLYSGIRDGKKALVALGKENIPETQYLCGTDCVGDSYLDGPLEDVACDWGINTPTLACPS